MSQPASPNRQSSLGAVVLVLYMAGILGVISAVVSATELDGSNALKFVLSAIAIVLAALCFSVGVFIDVQRP